jgi:hypothetical protein
MSIADFTKLQRQLTELPQIQQKIIELRKSLIDDTNYPDKKAQLAKYQKDYADVRIIDLFVRRLMQRHNISNQ